MIKKELDNLEIILCQYQSEMFERSIDLVDCSSIQFINKFMRSNLAERMDDIGFLWEANSVDNYLKELLSTIKYRKGGKKYPSNTLAWVGYLYRFFSYAYKYTSCQVLSLIKPETLLSCYEAYHSLDVLEAIKRLLEAGGYDTEEPISLLEIMKESRKNMIVECKK